MPTAASAPIGVTPAAIAVAVTPPQLQNSCGHASTVEEQLRPRQHIALINWCTACAHAFHWGRSFFLTYVLILRCFPGGGLTVAGVPYSRSAMTPTAGDDVKIPYLL